MVTELCYRLLLAYQSLKIYYLLTELCYKSLIAYQNLKYYSPKREQNYPSITHIISINVT